MDLSMLEWMLTRGDWDVVCAHKFGIIGRGLARRRAMTWRVDLLVLIGLARGF